MLIQSFFLRVFVYGLVGFAPDGDGAAVLVVADQHHHAFVGFDAECSQVSDGSVCPALRLPEEEPFQGFLLKRYEIELDPITGGQAPFTVLMAERPGRLPDSVQEGGRFSWVPRMASILGSEQEGRIDRACVNSPAVCRVPLSGWMRVKRGALSNCDFSDPQGAGAKTYSYQFRDSVAGSSRWDQALAEVVQISQRVSAGDSVRLNLKDTRGEVVEAVRLSPRLCTAEMPAGSRCVDVFIGNIGLRNPRDPRTAGPHFSRFYDLLADERSSRPTPFLSLEPPTPNPVQPRCRVVPPPPPPPPRQGELFRGMKVRMKSEVSSSVKMVLPSPDSRPICPMVVYND